MKRLFWLIGLFVLCSPAWAQTVVKPVGGRVALDTGRTTAAASTNAIDCSKGYDSLSVWYTGTTGTISTQLQVSCDGGATWVTALYPNGTTAVAAVTAVTAGAVQTIVPPLPCLYRLTTATCTACTLNATAFVMGG